MLTKIAQKAIRLICGYRLVPLAGNDRERVETAAIAVKDDVLRQHMYLRATGNERIHFVALQQRLQ